MRGPDSAVCSLPDTEIHGWAALHYEYHNGLLRLVGVHGCYGNANGRLCKNASEESW